MNNITLRDYQQDNSDKIIEAIKAQNKLILLKQAGGSGKTYTLLKTISKLIYDGIISKAIFVTPRINLTKQTHVLGEFGYHQGSKSKDIDRPIVIANLQTLVNKPIKTDLVVFDEVHLLTSLINKYIKGNHAKQYIGISATPYSSEGKLLIGWETAYNIKHPYDEKWLIKQGYLAPMQYYQVGKPIVEFKTSKATGEVSNKDSEKIVEENVLGDIVKSLIEKKGKVALMQDRTLVTCQNIRHAYLLQSDFEQRGFKTLIVTSKDRQGLKNLERFKNESKENILITVDMVSTGTDIPPLTDIVLARVFGSHTNYRQTVLRGTRLFDGKTHFRVWDFGGNFDRLGNPLDTPQLTKGKEKKEKPNCPQCMKGKMYIYDRKIDFNDMIWVLYKKCPECEFKTKDFKELDYIECSQCNKIHIKDEITLHNGYYGVQCDCGHFEAYERVVSKPLQATLIHERKEVKEMLRGYIKEPYLTAIVALADDNILAYSLEVLLNLNNAYTQKSKQLVIERLIKNFGDIRLWRYISNAMIEHNISIKKGFNKELFLNSQNYLYYDFNKKQPLTRLKIQNTLRKLNIIGKGYRV